MDKLVCRVISVADVPEETTSRHPQGRIGELYERLQATPVGSALEVQCRDVIHAAMTRRQILLKARRAGMKIEGHRVGKSYYVWRV